MMETIGLFGGTFAPPHLGHVSAARHYVEQMKPDKLLIMPTFIPPHKQRDADDTPGQRLEMCRAAFSDIQGVEISSYEIDKGGVSYTIDTLRYLTKPGRRICLLCGTDMFLTLPQWREGEKIFSLADICCISRYDNDRDELSCVKERYEREYGAAVTIIEDEPFVLSSTSVREMIENGQPLEDYLPSAVIKYIRENHLYGGK